VWLENLQWLQTPLLRSASLMLLVFPHLRRATCTPSLRPLAPPSPDEDKRRRLRTGRTRTTHGKENTLAGTQGDSKDNARPPAAVLGLLTPFIPIVISFLSDFGFYSLRGGTAANQLTRRQARREGGGKGKRARFKDSCLQVTGARPCVPGDRRGALVGRGRARSPATSLGFARRQ
jgi:hypothetical protein